MNDKYIDEFLKKTLKEFSKQIPQETLQEICSEIYSKNPQITSGEKILVEFYQRGCFGDILERIC